DLGRAEEAARRRAGRRVLNIVLLVHGKSPMRAQRIGNHRGYQLVTDAPVGRPGATSSAAMAAGVEAATGVELPARPVKAYPRRSHAEIAVLDVGAGGESGGAARPYHPAPPHQVEPPRSTRPNPPPHPTSH